PEARSLDLARLKHHVAVGEDDRGAEARAALERGERARKEPLPEWVVDQEERHAQQQRIVEVLQAIALRGAEIVGVSELGAQLLEDRPVAVAAGAAALALPLGARNGLHARVRQ